MSRLGVFLVLGTLAGCPAVFRLRSGIPSEIRDRPAFTSFDPAGVWRRTATPTQGEMLYVYQDDPRQFLHVSTSEKGSSGLPKIASGRALATGDWLAVVDCRGCAFVEISTTKGGARTLVGDEAFGFEEVRTPIGDDWTGTYENLKGVDGESGEKYVVRTLVITRAPATPGVIDLIWILDSGRVFGGTGVETDDGKLLAARYRLDASKAPADAPTTTRPNERPRVQINLLRHDGDVLKGRALVADAETASFREDTWVNAFPSALFAPVKAPRKTDDVTKKKRTEGEAVRALPPFMKRWRAGHVVEAPATHPNVRIHFDGTPDDWSEWTAPSDVGDP